MLARGLGAGALEARYGVHRAAAGGQHRIEEEELTLWLEYTKTKSVHSSEWLMTATMKYVDIRIPRII